MTPTILLFHAPEKEQLLSIELALFPTGVNFIKVPVTDHHQTLGYLAGVPGSAPATKKNQAAPKDLPDTMMLFAFLDNDKLNEILRNLKSMNVTLPYKAVLTENNQYWTPMQCFQELKEEHEYFQAQKKK